MKILLTGRSGQIGGELARSLADLGEMVCVPRAQMDLGDLDQVRDVIRAVKPDLIVHPAAYTAVDRAESEPALAMLINGAAPGVMAQEAQRLGAAMIHYSTDYVFDGRQTQPYDETAPADPLNAYGRSKLAGEQAVARHCEAHWILRTSWVYGVEGANFMQTVIRLARQQAHMTMVCDQVGAPTWARTVGRVTRSLLADSGGAHAAQALHRMRASAGVYHLAAAGETSWYEYASFIVDHLRARGVPMTITGSAAIAAIPSAALPTPAARPQSSRLALGKLESTFKLRMPHWKTDVAACLDEIIDSGRLR